jgi:hypothetical protein
MLVTLWSLLLVFVFGTTPALADGRCASLKNGTAINVARGLSAAGNVQGGIACLSDAAAAGDGAAAWELAIVDGIMRGGALTFNCPPFNLLPLANFFYEPFKYFPDGLQFSSCPETEALALKALELGVPDAIFAAAWSAIYFPEDSKLVAFRPPGDPWAAMEQAARAGSVFAAYEMGIKAHFGPGGYTKPNGRLSFDGGEWHYDLTSYEWMLKAARAGYPPAMDAIGAAHCPGHVISTGFVKQDFTAAADWLEKAKDAGYKPADGRLRRLLATNSCN